MADAAKAPLDAAEDKLARAGVLSYDGPNTTEVTDPDFAHLNEYVVQGKRAHGEADAAKAAYDAAHANLAAALAARQRASEDYASALVDVAFAQAKYDELRAIEADAVTGTPDGGAGLPLTGDGDAAGTWATPLAGGAAAVALLAAVLRRRDAQALFHRNRV